MQKRACPKLLQGYNFPNQDKKVGHVRVQALAAQTRKQNISMYQVLCGQSPQTVHKSTDNRGLASPTGSHEQGST